MGRKKHSKELKARIALDLESTSKVAVIHGKEPGYRDFCLL